MGVERQDKGAGLAHSSALSGLAQPASAISPMQGATDGITDNWLFHAAAVDSARILAHAQSHIILPDRGQGRNRQACIRLERER